MLVHKWEANFRDLHAHLESIRRIPREYMARDVAGLITFNRIVGEPITTHSVSSSSTGIESIPRTAHVPMEEDWRMIVELMLRRGRVTIGWLCEAAPQVSKRRLQISLNKYVAMGWLKVRPLGRMTDYTKGPRWPL
jgi:hypothetical protein